MSKQLDVCLLLDYYENMLTDKQRKLAEMYFNEDYSLAEISELTGITRQGVHDSVRRSETTLRELESNIGLVEKSMSYHTYLARLYELANAVHTLSFQSGMAQLQEKAKEMVALLEKIKKEND